MKLSVGDRILILESVFPREADFVGVRAMKSIRKKVDLETKEISQINLRNETEPGTGRPYMTWDSDKAKDKEVSFDSVEVKFLQENVRRLDTLKKIPEQGLDLFEKILSLKE